MCFKNLPVEFDATGKPYLKEGIANPYGYEPRQDLTEGQIKDLLARNGHIREVNFDPVTRVAGALAFHSVTDLEQRKVLETNAVATLFRGY